MKAAESITLGGVAAHTPVLTVACSRCDRAARYRLDTLIARHGPAFGIPGVLHLLAEDCQKRAFVDAYDLCGVHCPDLPGLFLGKVEDYFALPAPWHLFS